MPKRLLTPQGEFPRASLARRLAAMFYDFLLCVAMLMVVALAYQQGVLRLIYGSEQLMAMSQAGALDRDPLLGSLLLLCLFAFFAKFWTHNGQTLGMQVWGVRVQNADGFSHRPVAIPVAFFCRYCVMVACWFGIHLDAVG